MRTEVAGLLDRDAVTRLEQRSGGEPERRLGSGHDEYLFGLAPDRPRRSGDAPRSRREGCASPAGSPYASRSGVSARNLTSDELRPRRMREQIQRRQADLKRHHREAPARRRRRIEHGALADAGAAPRHVGVRRPIDRARSKSSGTVRADERAGTGSANEIPLVQQLLVRAQHRQPRDAKVGGEASRRWNSLPGTQTAVENGAAKSVVDLSVNRHVDVPVEEKVQASSVGQRDAGYRMAQK